MATRLEIAWAAGLFEGEGCATISSGQRQPRLQLQMVDEDVVRRFHRIVDCGAVHGYPYEHPRQDVWQWSVQGAADVLTLGQVLLPHLGGRRSERLREVLDRAREIVPKGTPRPLCKRGHPLSGTNVYLSPEGKRVCRSCRAWRARGYWRNRKEAESHR